MKKGKIIIAIASMFAILTPVMTFAGETADAAASTASWNQVLLDKFIEGGAGFMSTVLIALILGLAFCIERIIALSLASTNTKKLLGAVEENLASGNVEGAKDNPKQNSFGLP